MIKLKDISKFYYSDTTATLGLRNVNLEFKKGEFVAITGESGSGKSTLLNVISGMDTYEDGELYYNGEETSYYNEEDWDEYRRNKVSLIYQSYNLIDSYTALENIESVLLICEKNNGRLSRRERKKRAMECLKKVGLEKQARNRASHMSSGQKQRLGIARALAKNTEIIIADEPTGNLDIENGKQVMKILAELSKTKLVIVVTHNYEQAEPYATRKVRLYDSEVVENRILRPKAEVEDEIVTHHEKTKKRFRLFKSNVQSEEMEKDKFHTARKFVAMNRKATPHKNIFIFTFLLVTALSFSLMMGLFVKNMDDSTMRDIDNTAFLNTDMTRIVVKNIDGSAMEAKDVYKVNDIKRVDCVDLYGGIADINYYYIENEDYSLTYTTSKSGNNIKASAKDNSKYMKSSTVIKESDLSSGKLPAKYNEVVIYSDDKADIGKEMTFYFSNKKQWDKLDMYGIALTVVGIQDKEKNQAYFSEELCNAISVRQADADNKFTYIKRSTTTYKNGKADSVFDSERNIKAIYVLNPNLKENTARLSRNILMKMLTEDKDSAKTVDTIVEDAKLYYLYPVTGDKGELSVKVDTEGNISSDNIIELSSDLYWKIYKDHKNEQSTAYITDYAYTGKVLEALTDKGYEAISAFRTAAVEYNNDKTKNQFKMMGISAITILVIFVLNVLVVYSLMKLKRADFIILTSLGMSYRTVRQMNYYDLMTMMFFSDIIAFILMNVMAYFKVPFITSFINYYTPTVYVVVVVISLLMSVITAFFFSKHLLKKFRITSLKGE